MKSLMKGIYPTTYVFMAVGVLFCVMIESARADQWKPVVSAMIVKQHLNMLWQDSHSGYALDENTSGLGIAIGVEKSFSWGAVLIEAEYMPEWSFSATFRDPDNATCHACARLNMVAASGKGYALSAMAKPILIGNRRNNLHAVVGLSLYSNSFHLTQLQKGTDVPGQSGFDGTVDIHDSGIAPVYGAGMTFGALTIDYRRYQMNIEGKGIALGGGGPMKDSTALSVAYKIMF